MKSLRTFCAALTLALCLTAPAFAGIIECGDVAPPPPQPQAETVGDPSIGETVLDLIQSVLSLF